MKKIAMAVAAVAMATSMFAADVAAKVTLNGSLFNYAGKTLSALKSAKDDHSYRPIMALSVSGDKAGASFNIAEDVENSHAIWFAPTDAVKVTVGTAGSQLNKESIDWTESVTGIDIFGYMLAVNSNGLSCEVLVDGGNNGFWLTKADGKDAAIKPLYAKVGYSADFGTVAAYYSMNRQAPGNWDVKFGKYTDAKNMDFGIGYKGNFGAISSFVNVVGYVGAEKFKWVRPEVDVAGNIDSLGFQLFVAPLIGVADGVANQCEVLGKATLAIGSVSGYVYVKSADVLADTFAMNVKPGVTGNVGIMGYDVAVDVGIKGSDISVDVPVSFNVAW